LTGWLDDFLSTPNGAGHEELLPQKRGPKALQTGATVFIVSIRTDHQGCAWLGKTMEQPSSWRAVEILPTRLKAQLGHQTHLGMVGLMANRRYRFIPAAIHQKPTGSARLVQQVFDPSVKDMAEMGRTAGLLQMP
jgi:hypothetical protein